eukprot:scaffold2122_cov122-Cylindrotheca_fusiformis.AAC.5
MLAIQLNMKEILLFLVLAYPALISPFSLRIQSSRSTSVKTNQSASVGRKASHENSKKKNAVIQEAKDILFGPPDRDAMIARAAVLRQSILKKQLELQQLEREILCISAPTSAANAFLNHPLEFFARTVYQTRDTFSNSTEVLRRKLNRVRQKVGPNNRKYGSVNHYVAAQTVTGARILGELARNPNRLKYLVDPNTPTLMPHLPAIYSRLDKLEPHVAEILEKVLNKRQHLYSIEPYLGQVLERFDDIEPHFRWILKNIDVLAPYTGLLLKHIDELMLYAVSDDDLKEEDQYALAEQLLPYLEFYISRLDLVGPHLPLLRPHVPKLLKKNRIAKITPHIDRLFSRGYLSLSTSANLDILLFWLGWTLNVPLLPRIFFAIPGSPRFVTFLANRLPRRFARKCSNVACSVDGDYGASWNRLFKD